MFRLEAVSYKNILAIERLTLPGNKVTCIVGESGSGKTTLLRLLNKMVSPDAGEIYYQNIPLSSIPAIKLRRKVVMLQQLPVIFPGSVSDNLQAGLRFAEKAPVSAEKLRETLSLVHLRKELNSPAEKLSGGEKQRVAIARALLLDPRILIMDDSTSAVDLTTEAAIQKALDVLMKGRTSFVIAQRISTVMNADKIIVLDKGEVVAVGRHGDLMENNPIYAEIYNSQILSNESQQPFTQPAPNAAREM